MTKTGTICWKPGRACPLTWGNQLCVERTSIQAWMKPMASPATTVKETEVNLPNRAAAMAGMTKRVMVVGSSDWSMEAAKIPMPAASAVESIQLVPAKASGLKPRSTAPFSFSAAARVRNPNLVQR